LPTKSPILKKTTTANMKTNPTINMTANMMTNMKTNVKTNMTHHFVPEI
jgi:hypothetical protein